MNAKPKYCPYCGKEIDPSWKICPYCGHKLDTVMKEYKKKTNTLPFILGIITIILILISMIYSSLFYINTVGSNIKEMYVPVEIKNYTKIQFVFIIIFIILSFVFALIGAIYSWFYRTKENNAFPAIHNYELSIIMSGITYGLLLWVISYISNMASKNLSKIYNYVLYYEYFIFASIIIELILIFILSHNLRKLNSKQEYENEETEEIVTDIERYKDNETKTDQYERR